MVFWSTASFSFLLFSPHSVGAATARAFLVLWSTASHEPSLRRRVSILDRHRVPSAA
jgi:hypothetical protein